MDATEPPMPGPSRGERPSTSQMIAGTSFVWCESCDDLSSALHKIESGQVDEAPAADKEALANSELAKTAETYEKVVQGARSIRMLLFNDLPDISQAEYEAAMRDFIKSTNPQRWKEEVEDVEGGQAAVCMRLKKENSDVQWKLAKKLAIKEMRRTRSNLFTISAAMRNIFFWQKRIQACTATSPSERVDSPSGSPGEDSYSCCDVFLGGSCNPTNWRMELAIPFLKEHQVSYYNPQVDDWHEGLVEMEATAKDTAKVLMFVIDNCTRAIASILESTEYICIGRMVSLVVLGDLQPGQEIDGEKIGPREAKDLNRARRYLRDVAKRHGVEVHNDVNSALLNIKELLEEDANLCSSMELNM